jgi:hypothetical protein
MTSRRVLDINRDYLYDEVVKAALGFRTPRFRLVRRLDEARARGESVT